MRILILISLLFFTQVCHAQYDTIKAKSIEEVMSISLEDFRQKLKNPKAVIYCIVEMNLEKKQINFATNDFIIENTINAKYMSSKEPKFLFKFLVSTINHNLYVTIIKWRIIKKSNNRIELNNFLIREYYEVIH